MSFSRVNARAITRSGAVSDELRLKQQARQFIEDYPDVHGIAYAAARKILREHTGKQLNPQKIWWHRFSGASSSARTFTGWEHIGPPVESLTFLELLMQRFDAHDQEASDELQVYGGFYTEGPQARLFNEGNEIPMLPQRVMRDFWALNFATAYDKRIQRFWTLHQQTFCTLAKVRFLAAAGTELRTGSLPRSDFENLVAATLGKLPGVIVLPTLLRPFSFAPRFTLRTFTVADFAAHEALRLIDRVTGRQVLYLPGRAQAFHGFDDERQLYEWVRHQLADKASRLAFQALFLRSASARIVHGDGLQSCLDKIATHPWQPGQTWINHKDTLIDGDAFTYLSNVARREMQADAHALLVSNTTLRKQMWIGYLGAFIKVFGAAAPLGWPVALTLVGAGIAKLALDTDQAVHGQGRRQRKIGLLSAIFDSIFILFNLPMLAGIGHPGAPEADLHALEGLEGNEILTGIRVIEAPGRMRGIQQLGKGETWISLKQLPYRVHYSEALQTWLIVDPDNPFAFHGSIPVRFNAEGEWEVLPAPALKGGVPMEPLAGPSQGAASPYPKASSTFWDTYMRVDPQQETVLSEQALERQAGVINVQEAGSDDEVVSDSEGEEVCLDSYGQRHRIFIRPDGYFVGGRVELYSARDELFNQFLRHGLVMSDRQVELIEELVEDLSCIGYNNDVTLYRGGNGVRGTSGVAFRSGRIRVGDVLVNTDFTSFSENPYMARVFASSQGGVPSNRFTGLGSFDETSVVFELPAKQFLSATPIAPFSGEELEAESLFTPGHYFRIDTIQEMLGSGYKFMNIRLQEIPAALPGRGLYDLRSGEPFSREQFATRLGAQGAALVERFFPLPYADTPSP